MIAEILATGDEIRTGALVDSNSAYIARRLEEAGVEVVRHSSVGDDPDALVSILDEIACRADIAIVTGGLGPTDDDLTAAAAASSAGVELVLDPRALDSVETIFKARQWTLSPANKKQALLPTGANCLINPVGTAPGFQLKIERCQMFFLPGVPFEMRQMLTTEVLPRLIQLQGRARGVRLTKTLSTFGLGESATAEHLEGFGDRFPHIKLGFRAKFPEIHVKLYGSGPDEDELRSQLAAAEDWVAQQLGDKIFSNTGESLAQAVGNLLRARNETLALAESCTGGLIADLITEVPGSSDYFKLSAVTYANSAKINILGVSSGTLDIHGAVSEEVAGEMAQGVQRISGASYGLATSGIAGPGGGTDRKPVGTVCIGLATFDSASRHRYHFTFDNRRLNKRIFAAVALELLRRKLLKA
ncbi:MAG: competence/damage-inducible protein A [Desulfobacteraceae bacterium]|jgi:nicotinamide-nucleotide amidase|nr:competence/damage-inducible protein A [Desulfobacteraceae bacterium]